MRRDEAQNLLRAGQPHQLLEIVRGKRGALDHQMQLMAYSDPARHGSAGGIATDQGLEQVP